MQNTESTNFPFKAILWDMDGVIVDTGEFHYLSWKDTINKAGHEFTREMFKSIFGMNNLGLLNHCFPGEFEEDDAIRMGNEKEALYLDMIAGKAELLPGVAKWLQAFQDWGIKQAIASSAPQANIDAHVKELGIGRYFDAIISGALLAGKPDPAVFLKAAGAVENLPSNCIVIEDAVPGVSAAKRAGMKCIAVTTTNIAENLKEADLILEDLSRLKLQYLLDL